MLTYIDAKQFKQVYASLVPYMPIALCHHNVSYVLRRLYIAQFEEAATLALQGIQWKKSLETYIYFFGYDTLIGRFLEEHEEFQGIIDPTIIPLTKPPEIYPSDLLVVQFS